jgi:hypothetical protein
LEYFKYLDSMITEDTKFVTEIITRSAKEKAVFNKKN